MRSPKVTVIVPNYNHARFLWARLGSVLGQTFGDFELLFLDDASTDESRAVFAEFAGDPRVRAFWNARNSGSTFVQWNRAATEARGEYLWFAESDDDADPRLLAELVARLDANPRCGLAYCQSRELDEAGRIGRSFTWLTDPLDPDRWLSDYVNDGRDELGHYLIARNIIPNASAVLLRRSAWEAAGGAEPRMKLCGDWLLWAKILAHSDVAFVAEPLNFFREHGGSVRSARMRTLLYVCERYEVMDYIRRHAAVAEPLLRECCDLMGELWEAYASEDPEARQWQLRTYRAARRVDPWLHWRLFSRTVRPWAGGMKNRLLRAVGLRHTKVKS